MSMLPLIAFRNIFRNRRRTLFCVTAVGLAVFFIIFYSSFIGGMMQSVEDVLTVFDVGTVKVTSKQFEAESELNPVQYPAAEGRDLNTVLDGIKAIPHVKNALPRIKSFATLQESVLKHATLWGLRISEETKINHFNLTDRDDGIREGRWPEPGKNECAVGQRFAQKTGYKVGDKIPLKTVSAQFSDKMWAPVITGIFSFDYYAVDSGYIIVDFDRLQKLLVMEGTAQQIFIFGDKESDSTRIAAAVRPLVDPTDVIERWQDNYFFAMMSNIQPIYFCLYLVFLVVACLLIVNTITMIINERIKEIGMMGSLGMTRAEIVKVFFFESVFLAAAGATAGVIVGGLFTGIIQNFPFRWTGMVGEGTVGDMPVANTVFLRFKASELVRSWFMGVLVASLFTLIPSLKSAFVEPVEALRR